MILVLLLYALLLCVLSYMGGKKTYVQEKYCNCDGFFVNNRQSSALMVAFSIVASCVGGSATLGMAGLAWQVGTPAFWWLGTGAIGLCVLAFFLAYKVRQSAAYTLPEMMTTFLGAPARPLASIIIIFAWIAITAAQLSAMAALLLPFMPEALAALPTPIHVFLQDVDTLSIAIFLGAGIVILYACIGGQAAIIKSDMVQYVLLLLALVVAFFSLLASIDSGGMQNPLRSVPLEVVNADFTISKFSYFLVIVGGSYVVCPMLFGRLYSAKDSTTAQRGAFMAVIWLLLTAVLIVCVGLLCRAFIAPQGQGVLPETVLMNVLFEQLPAWAKVVAFLGIFSALISSADSSLITAATIGSNDILRKKSTAGCRWCTLIIGLGATCLALSGKGILQLLLMANDIYVCGIVAPVFVGMLFYSRYTFSAKGMAAAILVGGGFGFTAALSGENMYSYWGIAMATLFSLASIRRPQCAPCV